MKRLVALAVALCLVAGVAYADTPAQRVEKVIEKTFVDNEDTAYFYSPLPSMENAYMVLVYSSRHNVAIGQALIGNSEGWNLTKNLLHAQLKEVGLNLRILNMEEDVAYTVYGALLLTNEKVTDMIVYMAAVDGEDSTPVTVHDFILFE